MEESHLLGDLNGRDPSAVTDPALCNYSAKQFCQLCHAAHTKHASCGQIQYDSSQLTKPN